MNTIPLFHYRLGTQDEFRPSLSNRDGNEDHLRLFEENNNKLYDEAQYRVGDVERLFPPGTPIKEIAKWIYEQNLLLIRKQKLEAI